MVAKTSDTRSGTILTPVYRPEGDALTGLERYIAIQEIKLTKARYCASMDDHDFSALRSVFTDDCVMDWPMAGQTLENLEQFIAFLTNAMPASGPVRTRHFAHNLQVEFTSKTEASVRWDHHNWAWFEDGRAPNMEQWGQYREKYRQTGRGMWLICYFSEHNLYNSRAAAKRRRAAIADGGVD